MILGKVSFQGNGILQQEYLNMLKFRSSLKPFIYNEFLVMKRWFSYIGQLQHLSYIHSGNNIIIVPGFL